jgi:hypothetical protein
MKARSADGRRTVGAARVAAVLVWLAVCGAARAAAADSLVLASPVPRHGAVTAMLRLDPPASGSGTLHVSWTDGAGRLVLRRTVAVALVDARAVAIALDMRRAVVMTNRLHVRLVLRGGAVREADADFVTVPDSLGRGADGWGYPIIVWQDQTPARAAGLRRLGITAGRLFGVRGDLSAQAAATRMAPLLAADLRFYVENIATDFYAAYHRFLPDRPVTWAFDQARALHARDPADPAAFWRAPSLSDPSAIAVVRQRLAQHVRLFGPFRPLYYSLGDETGIADLSAAWDFDLSPAALAQFRQWLRSRYATLTVLNRQWSSGFTRWDDVVPMTTDQAIGGPGDNYGAWVDFKAFMDHAFASAVRAGTNAIHAADPTRSDALSAIEGAQIPGWGGYDYAALAPAVDVMEIYDAGNNVEIAQALNPRLAVLTTTAPAGDGALAPAERSRLWHELLLGNRGLIVWDEARALVDDQGRPTALGTSCGALFDEFAGGLAAQWDAARPQPGAAAILYSPVSFQIGWLLDRIADRRHGGPDWTSRDAEAEGGDSALRASMRRAASLLTHLGMSPRWISDGMVEGGILRDGGIRVLLLPRTIALSSAEVAAIRAFAAGGGLVLADTAVGLFDAHGRRRGAPPLADTVGLAPGWWDGSAGGLERLAGRLRGAGGAAPFLLVRPDGTLAADIDARVRRDGAVTLIGLQRDPDASGTIGDAEDVVLTLPGPADLYDLRRHRRLGRTDRVALAVGAAEPVMLALAPVPVPPLSLSGPHSAPAGGDVVLRIGQRAATPAAAARVVHVETLDPDGDPIALYSGNATLRGESVAWRIPFAVNDRAGTWTIRVSDRLGAARRTWRITVRARPGG